MIISPQEGKKKKNDLEMFQEDTLDLDRIDMELGWAENIGFNILRIYLRYLLWRDDLEGFKRKLNQVLNICNKHSMKVLLVLFDDCWDQDPQPGKQPDPIPGVHNAKWAANPGKNRVLDDNEFPKLREYVIDISSAFTNDERVVGWHLYNEPGNFGMRKNSMPLLVASIA